MIERNCILWTEQWIVEESHVNEIKFVNKLAQNFNMKLREIFFLLQYRRRILVAEQPIVITKPYHRQQPY